MIEICTTFVYDVSAWLVAVGDQMYQADLGVLPIGKTVLGLLSILACGAFLTAIFCKR